MKNRIVLAKMVAFFIFFSLINLQLSNKSFASCEIFDVQLTKTNCNPDKKFAVKINFKYQDVSNCFTIRGNGKEYGSFSYSNLPIVIDGLNGDCHTEYEFVITDCGNQTCHAEFVLGKVCCENLCNISNVVLERTLCDSLKKFYVYLNFKHQNTSSCFSVQVNGHALGKFPYTSLPVKLGPFEADCQTPRVFQIVDCDIDLCSARAEMEKVCCENKCELSHLSIEKSGCDSLRQFYAFLKFNASNTSDSFGIWVNGKPFGKFKYGNTAYKVGPLTGDCTTKYNFLIKDLFKPDCAMDSLWGPVCCDTLLPCKLNDLILEKTVCDPQNQFYVLINFKGQNTSECFRITGNGKSYGEFRYIQLPVKIGPFNGDCTTEYEFEIKDCLKPDCRISKFLGKVCCGVNPNLCRLFDFRFETECRENKNFSLFLNFNHQNTSDCFQLKINGKPYGKFPYAHLPIRIDSLPGDCKTVYKMVIQDCDEPACALEKNIGPICCDTSQLKCLIHSVLMERTECDSSNKFYVFIKALGENTSGCFKVYGPGRKFYGEFPYGSVPGKIGPLEADCLTNYVFILEDCHKPDCRTEKSLGIVCCNQDCELGDMRVERTPCTENHSFYAVINFNHRGTSDCFRLQGNGKFYGTFQYHQLPLKIGPLPADCNTPYEFVAIDCHNMHCQSAFNLGRVCCDSLDQKIYAVELKRGDCDLDSMFKLSISFRYREVSDSFKVYVNGHQEGTFAYNALPVTATRLLADCKSIYQVKIVDQKDTNIFQIRYIERPCCKPGTEPCKVFNLKATPQYCTGTDQYALLIQFQHSGTTNASFDVFDRTQLIGHYPFANLPVTILDFKKSGRDFDFVKVCENDNPACCASFEFRSIDCLNNPPNRFDVNRLIVKRSGNSVLVFSETELPAELELELFNLEGRIQNIRIDKVSPYEFELKVDDLSTTVFFLRVKESENSKVYKFFHYR